MPTTSTRLRLLFLTVMILIAASQTVLTAGSETITVSYKNADLRDVLNNLAAQAGVSINMDETVTGTVSFHFESVTFDECLRRLAEKYELIVTESNGFYWVTRQLIRISVASDTGLISVEIRHARLSLVLEELSRRANANLTLIGPAPPDFVNLILNGVALPDLVAFLADAGSCLVEERNGVHIFRSAGEIGRMVVRVEQDLVGVDLAGVPLSKLTRELSDRTGRAVICDPAAAQTQITVFFAPLPFDAALDAIAAANNLRVYQEGNLYRFTRGESVGAIRVENGRLSIDVRNTDILDVLAEVSRQAKLTILPERDVTGRVSGTVSGEQLERGLSAFLTANGFVLERDGQVYRVKRLSTGPGIIISVNDDGTVDVDVTNASLASAVTELAKKKGFGIVVYANVNWNITSVHLTKVTFEEALDRLLAGTTFTYNRAGDTYLIGEGINFRQGDVDFLQSEIIPIHNLQAEVVWNALPAAFPRQNIILLKNGNSLLVTGTPKLIAALKEFLLKVDVPQETVQTEIVPLRHIKAEEALKLLPPSLPRAELVLLKDMNSIAVTGSAGYRLQVRSYLEKIDVAAPMILFDVLVLQFSETSSRGGGLNSLQIEADGQNLKWDLGSLVGTIISPDSPAAMNLTASISAAVSDGRARVRANPKIATLSGTTAQFTVVTKYNYSWPMPVTSETGTGDSSSTTTEYKNFTVESGIEIVLTPWVSTDNEITLELKPRVSQYATSPAAGGDVVPLPGVMERSTNSTVRIMDGYTVVISGFIQETEETEISKVPILGSIPLLGQLFQSKKKTNRQDEFVIIITPHLVDDPTEISGLMAEINGEGGTPAPIIIDLDDRKRAPAP